MCMFISCCTQEMLSTPPATYTSPSPAIMRCEAMAMVCRPLEQKRLMVTPLTLMGSPARSAIWRAMLLPVAPSGLAQPISTSSTAPGSMPARSTAALTAWPPSVAPCVMLKAPFQLLARGVRAVETMSACGHGGAPGWQGFRRRSVRT
jgi:hypothetical protein